MESRFEFINEIEDTDFKKSLPDLYERCLTVENLLLEGKPKDCIVLARTQNERVVKYLYQKLMNKTPNKIYEMLKDADFKKRVGNNTLIKYADRIRSDGNEQVHSAHTNVNSDAAFEAKNILEFLVYVIENAAGRAAGDKERPETYVKRKRDYPAGTVSYQLKSIPAAPQFFDSFCGFVHYFVRPNDKFALNSLELVDADVYLYRLLRISGYDSILFIEMNQEGFGIYAYDGLSEQIFAGAAQNKIRKTLRAAGKRKIRYYSYAEEQKKQFAAEISYVLGTPLSKTAIVMPLAALGKNEYCKNEMIDIIRFLEKKGKKQNILILTMVTCSDLLQCFEESQRQLHPWADAIIQKKDRSRHDDRIQEAVKELKGRKQIIKADEYGVDEIANLIFRKILIYNNTVLSEIDKSKIFGLAELLLEHCLQKRKRFQYLPYGKMEQGVLRQLNELLNQELKNELFANELSDIVGSLEKERMAYSDRLHPLMVERVYSLSLNRYEVSGSFRRPNGPD